MTDEGGTPAESGARAGDDADGRDARLAALLSVRLRTDDDDEDSEPDPPDAEPARSTRGNAQDRTAPEPAPAPAKRARPRLAFAVLAVLLLTGVGLAYAGSRIIRSSTEGEVVTPVNDPTAPGYEALVAPTPTIVLLHVAEAGLDSVTVLSLPDPGRSGAVLLVPARTADDLPIFGLNPIEVGYDLGNSRVETEMVGNLLGTGLGETAVVDADRWADLVAPVAPITIDNPNEIEIDGDVQFPLGEIQLDADDVAAYLEARVEGESDLARLFRQQLFWEAWLDAVAADGTDAAVPGELDTGIGRFVRSLASGQRLIETLPVTPAAEGQFGEEPAFLPRPDEDRELVDRVVPFPVSPEPGARARLRLLNGTTDTSLAQSIAATLPPAGVQIVLIGNASSLDVEETTVLYAGDEWRDEARAVADILGVGDVGPDRRPGESADITVTLGADYG